MQIDSKIGTLNDFIENQPGEATGHMALEVAMDEMAEKLGMDPVEFRILNDTQVNPEKPAQTYSVRKLVECLRVRRYPFLRADRRPGRWHASVLPARRGTILTGTAPRATTTTSSRLSGPTPTATAGLTST